MDYTGDPAAQENAATFLKSVKKFDFWTLLFTTKALQVKQRGFFYCRLFESVDNFCG